MEVELTDDQKAFVDKAVHSGRFAQPEDAIRDALTLWEDRERRRAEILAAVDLADASCDRGEGIVITTAEGTRELAADIKRRGMDRLSGCR